MQRLSIFHRLTSNFLRRHDHILAGNMEYVFVGGGPASICGIASVLGQGVYPKQVKWVDQDGFRMGDFGSILSVGSSVPGNTSVESYQFVNNAIYELIPECAPTATFAIDALPSSHVCTLKIAAEPMRHISNKFRVMVDSIEGSVTDIHANDEGFLVKVKEKNGESEYINTKRVVLAIGAKPKKFSLPVHFRDIEMIHPNTVFIKTELEKFLKSTPGVASVAVIGSSHSAALAVMHLLEAGVTVKQFMNKEYKFATPSVAPDGTRFTMFDNTGLKGDVASFTKTLLLELGLNKGKYIDKYFQYIGNSHNDVSRLLEEHLNGCTHAVATIGYGVSSALRLNDKLLSEFSYNKNTTEFNDVKGLFGLGIAFPQEKKSISGEIESSVGYAKFWKTVNDPVVQEAWRAEVERKRFNLE